MNFLMEFFRLLTKATLWGPYLIGMGAYLLYLFSQPFGHRPIEILDYVLIGVAILLSLSGIVIMFQQLGSTVGVTVETIPAAHEQDANYVVRQLSQNYHVLRNQTSQGFFLSGVFMTIGMLVLIISLFGKSFGLQDSGVSLTSLASIVSQFISGTALLMYRLNFHRLNITSDKLDAAWRILSAYKLTEQLPDDKRAEATIKLIEALSITHTRDMPPSRPPASG